MSAIKSIHAYEIIDSRGYPTIEGKLTLDTGQIVMASIPAGASVGKYEALELRDNDMNRLDGMGVSRAVSYINDLIAPKLIGKSPLYQREIDYWLIKADGTKTKSNLGANTILAVSTLITKAGAVISNIPLFRYINKLYEHYFNTKISLEKMPIPIINIINGGKHANNSLQFQEFEIISSSSHSFTKAYQLGIEIYHELERVLKYRNATIAVGQEGGFTPNLSSNVDAMEVMKTAITQRNLKLGLDIFFGLDIAASQFYKNDKYYLNDQTHAFKKEEYFSFIKNLVKQFSILILEDPINEDDWSQWKKLNSLISKNTYLVGDDLITTNKDRLATAIKEKACSTVLIKPNQIGTISETLEVVDLARKNNFNYIVSHRSAETNDTFLSDFAVAVQAEFVKFGAPCRGERVAKYNRLWEIEREEL